MATNIKTKKQEVFKYVELNLGGGMIDVELDPDHYETALGAALAKFRQRSDNSVEESYMFLPTVIDQNEYTNLLILPIQIHIYLLVQIWADLQLIMRLQDTKN